MMRLFSIIIGFIFVAGLAMAGPAPSSSSPFHWRDINQKRVFIADDGATQSTALYGRAGGGLNITPYLAGTIALNANTIATGTLTATGQINSSGGGISTGGSQRISNAGVAAIALGSTIGGVNFYYEGVYAILDALVGLTPAADKFPYFTSGSAGALATVTSYARTLLDDADAITARGTLDAAPSVTYRVAASNSRESAGADYQCDGTADEVQINLAIIAAAALPNGGTVRLLDGDFTLADTIQMYSNVTLEGQGWGKTVLAASANSGIRVDDPAPTDVQYVTIRDLTISTTGNNKPCIVEGTGTGSIDYLTIERCELLTAGNTSYGFGSLTAVTSSRGTATNWSFLNNRILLSGTSTYGILIPRPVDGLKIIGNDIKLSSTSSFNAIAVYSDALNFNISNNTVYGVGHSSIAVSNAYNGIISGNNVTDAPAVASEYGIEVEFKTNHSQANTNAGKSVIVNGNRVTKSSGTATGGIVVRIDGAETTPLPTSITVCNNLIDNATTGIALTHGANVAVFGNTFGSGVVTPYSKSANVGTHLFRADTGITATSATVTNLTASRVLTTDANKMLASGAYSIPSSLTTGDLLYASSSSAVSGLADVTAGSFLRSGGTSTAPAWSAVTIPNTIANQSVVYATSANALGASTGLVWAVTAGFIQQLTSSAFSSSFQNYVAGTGGASIQFAKSRNATPNSHTIVQDGDTLMGLWSYGSDGTAFRLGGHIQSKVDGTPGASDMPTRFEFSTSPDGSITPSLRLTIKSTGVMIAPDTYASTVGVTNRDLFIDDTGIIGYVSSARTLDGLPNKVNERDVPTTITAELLGLNPTVYDRADGTKNEIGLIAEDVAQTKLAASIPGLVSYRREELPARVVTHNDGTTETVRQFRTTDEPETVNYSKLTVPMLEIIQRQQRAIEDLQARVAKLEAIAPAKAPIPGGSK